MVSGTIIKIHTKDFLCKG